MDGVGLTHGRTLALLTELGLAAGVAHTTFREYVKGLRRLGIPFAKGTRGPGGGRVVYRFGDVMELAVALTLRVYGVVPDVVIDDLKRHRNTLREIYSRSGSAYETALTPTVHIQSGGEPDMVVGGVFVDLDMQFGIGRVARLGTPRVVTAYEALQAYCNATRWDRACLPLDLTSLARRIEQTPVWQHAMRHRENDRVPEPPPRSGHAALASRNPEAGSRRQRLQRHEPTPQGPRRMGRISDDEHAAPSPGSARRSR